MLAASKNWLNELSDVLVKCDDEIQGNSIEYEFYEIKGFDPERIRLAVYKLNHTNCWEIGFQQRKGVWHACGSFNENNFFYDIHPNVNNSWRDDIECLKYGFNTPVDWIRSFVK